MSIMTCRGIINIKFRVLVTVVGDRGNVIDPSRTGNFLPRAKDFRIITATIST